MICASYTRKSVKFGEIISIPEQNEQIEKFARRYRMTVSKKFTDRKEDWDEEDGFLEMKEAGMNRRFDCILFWSVMNFGKDPLNGYNLLRYTFVPAGIDFAVVCDNFFSAGKTEEEIQDYLQEKYKERRDIHNVKQAMIARELRMNTLYGYKVVNGDFVIDEKVESNVRQIFRLALDSKTKKEICKWLNDNKITAPQIYLRLEAGKDIRDISTDWEYLQVKKILTDKRYMGIRQTSLKGVVSEVPMPAYINEETYNKLNPDAPIKRSVKRENPLFKMVYDKDTMIRMYVGDYMSDGGWYYYVGCKNEMTRSYAKKAITASEVIGYVELALRKEQLTAQNVFARLTGERGREEYLKRTETLRLYIKDLMDQLLNEADGGNCDDAFGELDSRYTEAQAELERYQIAFGENNPWVRLFLELPEFETLNYRTAKEYIDKVLIIKNEKVELLPMHYKWKELFPKEWLEV